jgi:hypothetical protein
VKRFKKGLKLSRTDGVAPNRRKYDPSRKAKFRKDELRKTARLFPGPFKAAVEAAKQADEEDAMGHEALGVVLQIMRTERLPRYAGTRLSAACRVLDERRGKPAIREIKDDPNAKGRTYKAEFADGDEVPVDIAEYTPTAEEE